MGEAAPRSPYQYKPVVQKHGEIGKSAYSPAISPHPGAARAALITRVCRGGR